MKVFKRNAVIITVLVFVCVAVYLNWSYDKKAEVSAEPENSGEPISAVSDDNGDGTGAALLAAENGEDTQTGETGLFYTGSGTTKAEAARSAIEERFAAVRLQRKQARDEAQSALQTVAGAEGASQETVDAALQKMADMAEIAVKEAELETIITSKGFIDCVVYLTEDSATVTVASETGLSNAAVARITDVIISETDLTASQLTVIEIDG